MAVRRRSTPSEGNLASVEALRDFEYRKRNQRQRPSQSEAAAAQASDGLPLPLHLTNAMFILMIFSVIYSLLHRWRGKIQSSTPLRLVSFSELTALVALFASVVYLIGFFGIGIVHSLVSARGSSDDEAAENEENFSVQPPPVSAMREKKINAPTDRFIIQEGSIKPCIALFTSKFTPPLSAADEEIVNSVLSGTKPSHSLESRLGDCRRAAAIRREALQRSTGKSLEGLPLEGFDYESILGQCCGMPVGYVQIPVGIVGPLLLDGKEHSVPMATTEGVLVASTNRGCKAIFVSGGATSVVLKDGMTRAPVVRFDSAKRAAELKFFLEDPENFDTAAVVFNRSSGFARLQSIKCAIAGRNLYIRFCCSTGDAMRMNMVSKGVQNVLDFLQNDFPDMDVIGLSGNYCSDKKPTAINWIEGRGKSVVCEAIINEGVIKKVLKTSVEALVELNTLKNLSGSAVAGALGGFNAHASNIVTAIYLATGQDPAQNVESSHCITMMEAVNGGKDLHVSVTMPSIEVGTIGGGTQLASQSACLNLLGLKGANRDSPGENSRLLATIVAGSVLAGELSLMSAIATGQLVQSHMKYNRSSRDLSDMPS